jgi:hypothetical protein
MVPAGDGGGQLASLIFSTGDGKDDFECLEPQLSGARFAKTRLSHGVIGETSTRLYTTGWLCIGVHVFVDQKKKAFQTTQYKSDVFLLIKVSKYFETPCVYPIQVGLMLTINLFLKLNKPLTSL